MLKKLAFFAIAPCAAATAVVGYIYIVEPFVEGFCEGWREEAEKRRQVSLHPVQ